MADGCHIEDGVELDPDAPAVQNRRKRRYTSVDSGDDDESKRLKSTGTSCGIANGVLANDGQTLHQPWELADDRWTEDVEEPHDIEMDFGYVI